MTLSDTATAQLWESFRAGGGASLVREAVELVLQELIEAEATEAIGAGRYERTEARVTARNGHRPRLLATRAGDVELKIPKLRKGSFLPSLLEPRRRIDRALWAVVMEAYVAGVSTRSVDDLVAALGAESGISKSEVSRICGGLDEVVEAFRSRRLDHVEFPYVYLDATYLNVRNTLAQPASMATVVATGITADGNREVLGCGRRRQRNRGVLAAVPRLAARPGPHRRASGDLRCAPRPRRRRQPVVPRRGPPALPGALHPQPPRRGAQIAPAHGPPRCSRTIFAQPDAGAVADAWDQVADQLAARFAKVGPLMDGAKAEVLAFATFPRAHWQKIWSTNPLERINKEIKRRSRVVGIFPNEASAIRLVGAILADLHDEWQATDRRYLSEDSMSLLYPERDTIATAELTIGNHHRGSTQKPTT